MPHKYIQGFEFLKGFGFLFLGMTGAVGGWIERHASDLIKIGLLIGGFLYSMNMTMQENSQLIKSLQFNQKEIQFNQKEIISKLADLNAHSVRIGTRVDLMEKIFYKQYMKSVEREKKEDAD